MQQFCTDCRKQSPPVHTEDSLLSAACGWRLQRTSGDEGRVVLQWRCPECWRRYKSKNERRPGRETARSLFRAVRDLLRKGPPG